MAVAISAASLGIASLVVVTSPAGATGGGRATSRFAAPSSIASVGPWIAVANRTSSTLTLLRATDGALVRTVSHAALGVTNPTSLVAGVVAGRRVAFVGGDAGRVVELALTAKGTAVAVSRRRESQLKGCAAKAATYLASDGHGHLVAACGSGALGVWSAASGALERAVAPSASRLTHATALAVLGATAYVTNAATAAAGSAPDGVTAISITTGRRLRSVTNATNPAYAFSAPSGIASDGSHLWVANATGNTVDELAGATLAFLGSSNANLTSPAAVIATPSHVWVSSADTSWSMVTQFDVVGTTIESPWMMCNTSGPYDFGNPSGFALRGSMLWVANASSNLIDQMRAGSGALVGTYR